MGEDEDLAGVAVHAHDAMMDAMKGFSEFYAGYALRVHDATSNEEAGARLDAFLGALDHAARAARRLSESVEEHIAQHPDHHGQHEHDAHGHGQGFAARRRVR